MIEKRLYAVPSQLLTLDGQSNGLISLPDSTFFKVKQVIFIASSTQSPVELEVKRIDDSTSIWIGPKTGPIDTRFNASAFLMADGAFVFANEQPRPGVPEQVIPRAVFEEEPTLAIRSIAVDKLGNPWSATNPLPVDANVTIGGVSVDLDAFNSQPDSALSVGSEDGTKTGTRHVMRVAPDGSVMARNFSALVPEPKTKIQIVSRNLNGDITVARFYNGASVICDLSLSYDINGDISSVERL